MSRGPAVEGDFAVEEWLRDVLVQVLDLDLHSSCPELIKHINQEQELTKSSQHPSSYADIPVECGHWSKSLKSGLVLVEKRC